MNADQQLWADAKHIFDRLVRLPAERWQARLDRLAPSPLLREYVQRLFAARDKVSGILDQPISINLSSVNLVGRQLGPWILETELGRGGSALVYRARATHNGTERVAALKLLTLGSL